jgi:hypothetical protein
MPKNNPRSSFEFQNSELELESYVEFMFIMVVLIHGDLHNIAKFQFSIRSYAYNNPIFVNKHGTLQNAINA